MSRKDGHHYVCWWCGSAASCPGGSCVYAQLQNLSSVTGSVIPRPALISPVYSDMIRDTVSEPKSVAMDLIAGTITLLWETSSSEAVYIGSLSLKFILAWGASYYSYKTPPV